MPFLRFLAVLVGQMKILYVERKAAQDKSHRINKPQKATRMSALLNCTIYIIPRFLAAAVSLLVCTVSCLPYESVSVYRLGKTGRDPERKI